MSNISIKLFIGNKTIAEIILALIILLIIIAMGIFALPGQLKMILWPLVVLTALMVFLVADIQRLKVGKDGLEIESKDRKKVSDEIKAATELRHPGADKKLKNSQLQDSNTVLSKIHRKISKRILWVDDYPDNNIHEISMLLPLGINIIQTTTTKAALQYVNQNAFDLIISDMGRKENGQEDSEAGVTLVNAIDGILPVIVYTSDKTDDRAERALAAGAKAVEDMPAGLLRAIIDNLSNLD